MFQVDPRFQQGRKAAKSRHRKRLAQRLALFGLVPAVVVLGGLALFTEIPQRGVQLVTALIAGNDDTAMLVQVDGAVDAAPVVPANVFLNIAGDPTLLRINDQSSGAKTGRTEGSGVFDIARFGLPTIDRFVVIRDDLVVTEKRLMIELPSSREDFAFFLAQRDQAQAEAAERGLQMDAALQAELAQLNDPIDLTGLDGGDYALDGSTAPEAPVTESASIAPRNNTSVASTRREADRRPLYRDAAILIELDQPMSEVLAGNGVAEDQAGPRAEALAAVLPLPDPLPRGAVIGLRFLPLPYGGERLGQVSLYLDDVHAGTAWLDPQGRAIPATDPWLDADLPALARAPEGDAGEGAAIGEGGSYRMLDAIYSAAVRDGVPAALAGELISILSRSQDLERRVTGGDKVTMAYSHRHGPGGRPAGQWLYVGIDGPSGHMQCYILPDRAEGGYRCASPGAPAGAVVAGGGGVLQTPVAGVMSSRFGPRNHPILKTVRLHAGLDWAAPTGTPIRAAAAGKVALAAESGAYGNLVVLSHPDGLETRYAHMNKFAAGLKPGDVAMRRGGVVEVPPQHAAGLGDARADGRIAKRGGIGQLNFGRLALIGISHSIRSNSSSVASTISSRVSNPVRHNG